MQKTILALLCAGITTTAVAQEKSVLLFGNLSGSTNTQDNPMGPKTVSSSFNIAPGVGYQFTDRWTLGVEGSFSRSGIHQPPMGIGSTNLRYGGGVFGRYTLPITNLLYFYTQADATYTRSRSHLNGTNMSMSGPVEVNLKMTPAIGINIKNGYAMNFGFGNLGFLYGNDPSGNLKHYSFGYNLSQGLSIGMSKNFIHHVHPVPKTNEKEGPESE